MTLTVTRRALDTLHHYPGNARRGDVEAVRDSLRRNGQYRPLLVQASTSFVLTGNHTMDGMLAEGWTEADVTVLDCDDDTARRIVIADNRTSDLGTYDDRALVTLLRELGEDLSGTGFDLDDYDDLLAAIEEQDANPPDDDDFAAYAGQPGGAYGEGGSADGTNVRQTPSYREYQEAYATRATRFIALVYPLAQYAWVVGHLSRLVGELGVESNADVVIRLVADRVGEQPPAEDAEVTADEVAAADATAEEAPAQ